MMNATRRPGVLKLLAPALLALSGCAAREDEPADVKTAPATEGRLILLVQSAETMAEGQNCVFHVTARNSTGAAALNVQAAWMAQTEGFGIISDYQVLGNFAVDESRAVRLAVFGAPCHAVRKLELTRAVCTVSAGNPPQSCADLVTLDGGETVPTR